MKSLSSPDVAEELDSGIGGDNHKDPKIHDRRRYVESCAKNVKKTMQFMNSDTETRKGIFHPSQLKMGSGFTIRATWGMIVG